MLWIIYSPPEGFAPTPHTLFQMLLTKYPVGSTVASVVENGTHGNHPHLNHILKIDKRADNVRRTCYNMVKSSSTSYPNLFKVNTVKWDISLLGHYLVKEPNYQVLYGQSTLDDYKLAYKDMCSHKGLCKIYHLTFDQLLQHLFSRFLTADTPLTPYSFNSALQSLVNDNFNVVTHRRRLPDAYKWLEIKLSDPNLHIPMIDASELI